MSNPGTPEAVRVLHQTRDSRMRILYRDWNGHEKEVFVTYNVQISRLLLIVNRKQ
jgi:hypothetical protein